MWKYYMVQWKQPYLLAEWTCVSNFTAIKLNSCFIQMCKWKTDQIASTIYFYANKVGFPRSGHNYTFLCWHDFKKNGLVYGRHLHAAILSKYKAITARSLILLQKNWDVLIEQSVLLIKQSTTLIKQSQRRSHIKSTKNLQQNQRFNLTTYCLAAQWPYILWYNRSRIEWYFRQIYYQKFNFKKLRPLQWDYLFRPLQWDCLFLITRPHQIFSSRMRPHICTWLALIWCYLVFSPSPASLSRLFSNAFVSKCTSVAE